MIEIEAGPIVGEVVDSASNMAAYRGVPYAAPPLGDLRWVEPQPVVPWDEPRVCTEFGPACPQSEGFFSDVLIQERPRTSEDCLYLTVWCREQGSQCPVMVWIHGGGFENGWIGGRPAAGPPRLNARVASRASVATVSDSDDGDY